MNIHHLYQLLFLSNRLRISFGLGICYYLILWLLWLTFRVFFIELTQSFDSETWQTIIYLQHKFNLRLSAIIITFLLVIGLIPKRILNSEGYFQLSRYYYFLIILLTLLFYIFNWGHYVYLAEPINVSALRFLEDGDIATSFVWQSYPVITLMIVWLGFSVLLFMASFYWVGQIRIKNENRMFRPKIRSRLLAGLIVFLLVALAIFGRFSQYPLRWSEAFFSTHIQASHLTLNPVLYFANTLKNKNIPYDLEKTKQSYQIVADFLEIPNGLQDEKNLTYARKELAQNENGEKYNVVFIMLESLGANRLGAFGNPLDATPNLDAISQKSYVFNNFFVPSVGTARTVYSSLFGIADVSPVKTATRNPLIINQSTLINEFDGYQKHYLIGGSASWANIRAMLQFNIADLNLYEGTYHNDGPKIDVWGISDTNLLRKAHQIFETENQNNQKFVAYIQTAGNHRPFTIPDDNENFEKQTISDELLTAHGFYSLDQFNGIRFLDHNLGYFFSLFEQSSYYGKTIFVMFGDHNDRTHSAPHMRNLESQTGLDGLHVPLIIYAPGIITEPMVFEKAASLVDIFPTASYLANVPVVNKTMGKNLLQTDDNHIAFTLGGDMLSPTIGLVQNNYYFRSNPNGSNAELFDLNSNELIGLEINENNESNEGNGVNKQLFDYFNQLGQGIYESSRYLLHNNGK